MTENQGSLADTLAKVSSLSDLEAALPPQLAQRLGEGDNGKKRMVNMLTSLSVFADASFERDAFNQIVAYDEEQDQPLLAEEADEMLNVGIEAGFLKIVPSERGDRYLFHSELHKTMRRLLGE